MKILHFADAHIDAANYGRHDPETGIPLRIHDFLKSLDTIVDTAIQEKVDLMIFAGDAYKDRSPEPTYQREWDKRMVRLSKAEIPTVVLIGNHDTGPSAGRAHALAELATLEVPYIHVVSEPKVLGPKELGIPAQVIAIPWVNRSGMYAVAASQGHEIASLEDALKDGAGILEEWTQQAITGADHGMPLILTAHASIQGALMGSERAVILGTDLVFSGGMVKNPRLDYVAMGHIHKPQNLNEGAQPPVIYPGSIERVDFGEAKEDKFFVVADVQPGKTQVDWRKLDLRPFVDLVIDIPADCKEPTQMILDTLGQQKIDGAMLRVILNYPDQIAASIDDAAIRKAAGAALDIQLAKRPVYANRVRLPAGQEIQEAKPADLLEAYFATTGDVITPEILTLGKEIIASVDVPGISE
jgi:exonuclease SbcD